MISSAEFLTNYEQCRRWGYYAQTWEPHKMTPMVMFHAAVRAALTEDTPDPGQWAGEEMITLAGSRGLEMEDASHLLYTCAISHAAAADLIVTEIRNSQEGMWSPAPPPIDHWLSSAQMNGRGTRLRRFLAVSGWGEDREAYERGNWYTLGEVAHYGMPLQLVVAVLGPLSGGRRHNPWSKALLHPSGSQLRFKLRRRSTVEGFKETWRPVYRYEHDEIAREKWLQAMDDDEVLRELLFVVEVPVPEASECSKIRDIAKRALDQMFKQRSVPAKQLTSCRNPIHPCPFLGCCWGQPETKPSMDGYDARPALQLMSIRNSSGSSLSPELDGGAGG